MSSSRSFLDPALFDPASVDEETRKLAEGIEAVLATMPRMDTLPPEVTRAQQLEGGGLFGTPERAEQAVDRRVEALGREVPVRVIVPDQVEGVYLHIHGGGWTFGAPELSDVRNLSIAKHGRLAVVSVDYRLAPEHPYPAAPDDCESAAVWLVEHAKQEFGSDRICIGGESAGAHLSAVTLLRMRDRHGFRGFARANLVYGCYDLALTPSAKNHGERNLVLNTPIIEWFVANFTTPDRVVEPDLSPLRADLAGLPPATFSVGTLDPLLDDTLFMHDRWVAAGNEAELRIYPGGLHGFDMFPGSLSKAARTAATAFLRG